MTSIHENERDGDSETWEETGEWVNPAHSIHNTVCHRKGSADLSRDTA